MRALWVLLFVAAPGGAWAGVDGLGAMIRQGYQEQAAAYREFQKALKSEPSSEHEERARELEAQAHDGDSLAGAEMGVRLVKVQE